jgi:hypothetical protein
MSKKGDFENLKVQNRDFSTKSVPDSCGFPNSAVCWGPKNSTNRGIPVPSILIACLLFIHLLYENKVVCKLSYAWSHLWPIYVLVWPRWWSFADVSQQGLYFSKQISKTKIISWFDFHRCSHGSSKSALIWLSTSIFYVKNY